MRGILSFLVALLLAAQVYAAPLVNSYVSFPSTGSSVDPFDVTTASYDSKSASVSGQSSSPQGVAFKSDGTEMYISQRSGSIIYQYDLSTAWDVSTASYASVSYTPVSNPTSAQDIFFNPDGDIMYLTEGNGSNVYQYTLSTAWDITSASYASKSLSTSAQSATDLEATYIGDSGNKVYVSDAATDTIYQYNLSTAYDLSTASYSSNSISVSANEGNPRGLVFSDDGTAFYIVGTNTDTVYRYNLTTAWDLSTASYASQSLSVSENSQPSGLAISADNRTIYTVDISNDAVYQYSD